MVEECGSRIQISISTFSSSLLIKPSFMSFYEEVQNFRSRVTFTETNFLSGELQTQSSHQEKTQMSVFSRWAGVAVGVWL